MNTDTPKSTVTTDEGANTPKTVENRLGAPTAHLTIPEGEAVLLSLMDEARQAYIEFEKAKAKWDEYQCLLKDGAQALWDENGQPSDTKTFAKGIMQIRVTDTIDNWSDKVTCPNCKGDGEKITDTDFGEDLVVCYECKGKGQVPREDAVKAFLASKGLLDSYMKFDRSKVVKALKDELVPFPADLVTLSQSVSVSIISKALLEG